MKRGEDLIQDLRAQGFMRCETTQDGKAVVMRKRDRWTVVPLRWLTDEAVDTIKAQAGISLV
ncbi:hypothetical protein B7P34_27330 [Streptosporangium nondiastaticum]|uniref:Uncharacterized protein n=2 Tax=Actinomycetes TaxID=1760 RepID=A0A9X7JKU0_9ACTN|nr:MULTISPECIES: hypothetical protein [Actinomycetes]MCQ8770861.1 hypothetical protein [Streptomyces telluris]NJP79984.1 hypothetical protein [Streptomyces telluris]PSJ25593.1 hypothetical protein B7P34_27330 [Streptosporangium nondiastaticum]WKU45931.1 hypothetical protein Q3V23_18735 [Streptomyces sp. VNUA116]